MSSTVKEFDITIGAGATVPLSIPTFENNGRGMLVIIKNVGANPLTAAAAFKQNLQLGVADATLATALGTLAADAQTSAEYTIVTFRSLDLTFTSTLGTTLRVEACLRG